jgi:hypothetical protein
MELSGVCVPAACPMTFPVGPYCGIECSGYVVQNGIAYHALHELAWGYSSYDCRVGSHRSARQCTEWTFLDATTGQVIDMGRRGTLGYRD